MNNACVLARKAPRRLAGFIFFVIAVFLTSSSFAEQRRFEFESVRMGVPVRIVLYSDIAETAEKAASKAFEQFKRLDGIMSDYDSESELSRLGEKSSENWSREGRPVWIPVGKDLFRILESAKHFSEISEGAFDITISPLSRLWRRSRRMKELPKQKLIDRAKELVGRELWELDPTTQSVRLLRNGMKLDLGGIAKGYAIDRAFEEIQKLGIETVLIDAGGDFRVGKAPPEGWKIELDGLVVPMENIALATSGDRFQFVEIDGVRYSHLIDPKTGLGLTGSCTVHVAAPTATTADALASAVAVSGPEKGLKLIESEKNVSAKIVLQGEPKEFRSKNWPFQ